MLCIKNLKHRIKLVSSALFMDGLQVSVSGYCVPNPLMSSFPGSAEGRHRAIVGLASVRHWWEVWFGGGVTGHG